MSSLFGEWKISLSADQSNGRDSLIAQTLFQILSRNLKPEQDEWIDLTVHGTINVFFFALARCEEILGKCAPMVEIEKLSLL